MTDTENLHFPSSQSPSPLEANKDYGELQNTVPYDDTEKLDYYDTEIVEEVEEVVALDSEEDEDFARLNYVCSQDEPTDLSQDNAVDFVNRFVSSSKEDSSPGINFRKATAVKLKSPAVSSAKGICSLAKRIKPGTPIAQIRAFEWDDNSDKEKETRDYGPDMVDVGMNTQIAAEAMEVLCNGPSSGYSSLDAYPGPENVLKDMKQASFELSTSPDFVDILENVIRKKRSARKLIRKVPSLFGKQAKVKEGNLHKSSPKTIPDFICRDVRRRRNLACVRILLSQHLDDDTIKQQKRILARFGLSVAISSVDATHFIADRFARTRNMLEAIALGKPVVTSLWLESCGQAGCLIDEKNYILRDVKKEKEIGFSLPMSLAQAKCRPLLKGHKVFITPNVKPDKEMIISLIRTVHGQAVEQTRMALKKDQKNIDGFLVLSCEEDRSLCEPFLSKGIGVYSSEFLLNGIVTQKLEFARHRLFVPPVKRKQTSKRRPRA